MTDGPTSIAAPTRLKEKQLTTAATKEPIRCVGIKLSETELTVISIQDIPSGTDVTLGGKQEAITMTAEQSFAPTGRPGVYQVQLKCTRTGINLVQLLSEDGAIDFDSLRLEMARMHMPDQSFFRLQPNLSKIAHSHKAFPIRHQNLSLWVLISKELTPAAASKLDAALAASQVVILKVDSSRGRKSVKTIWPLKLTA